MGVKRLCLRHNSKVKHIYPIKTFLGYLNIKQVWDVVAGDIKFFFCKQNIGAALFCSIGCNIGLLLQKIPKCTLREKCLNTEFFLVHIFLYSVRIQENTDHKKLRIWYAVVLKVVL